MIEKAFLAAMFKLAVSMSGYQAPDESFPLPEVEFLTTEKLSEKACEREPADNRNKCAAYMEYHILNALFDRWSLPRKIYIDKRFERGMQRLEPHALSILLHEDVHVLQLYWKHHNNPEITSGELKADEEEAYVIQRLYMSQRRTE